MVWISYLMIRHELQLGPYFVKTRLYGSSVPASQPDDWPTNPTCQPSNPTSTLAQSTNPPNLTYPTNTPINSPNLPIQQTSPANPPNLTNPTKSQTNIINPSNPPTNQPMYMPTHLSLQILLFLGRECLIALIRHSPQNDQNNQKRGVSYSSYQTLPSKKY